MKSTLCRALWQQLKKQDLKRSGSLFFRDQNGLRSEIQIVSSKWSRKDHLEATINLVIYVKRIQSIIGVATSSIASKEPESSTKYWLPQVSIRVGLLFSEPDDKWWEVFDEKSLEMVTNDMLEHINCFIFPEMERWSTEDRMLAHWKSGEYGWMSAFQRKKFYVAMTSDNEEEVTAISRGVDKWHQYCIHHNRLDETKPHYKL